LLGVAPVIQETSSARGRRAVETLLYCDWVSLRYQHTLALRTLLAVRGNDNGPLLCPVNKAGKITIRRLSDQAVLGALQKRARQATVKGFSPHDLRRTFISDLLDAGADIATVQRMAGHASPETTSRYDRRGEATKRRAASLLHLAYESRTGGAE
jgi:integrase